MTSTNPADIPPALGAWFTEHARDLPWRREGVSPWGILVSEIMLQQTPVVRVIPRLEMFLERWPTPAHLADATAGDVVRAWDRLGYPRRALNLHRAAIAIVERHDGVVPSDVDELLALPGIGDYTARAVAVFAFGLRHPVVDTNVRRVLARAVAGVAEAGAPSTRRDLAAMSAMLPADDAEARVFNAATMELGAVVCTARAPRCGACPIAESCAWRAAGFPAFEGVRAPAQKSFAGSDRHVRGLVLQALRSSDHPVDESAVRTVWHDEEQLARATAGLVADGLVVRSNGTLALPS
ncbi:A/G-specific adenine glycosylase [Marisediminicola sp. LYQ134]|uniref:A/G-specific adenine glycosylase n=1 Tax=unclassified Marisediminicola TaxID=2618316 RepID=UPI0039838847